MGSRLVLAMVAAVVVVAVGGIGFAAFTSNAYVNASGSAGYEQLTWYAPAATYCSGSYNTYSASVSSGYVVTPGDTLLLSDGNLAPGDYCTFDAYLYDTGSLPVTVSGAGLSAVTAGCSEFLYGDNINGDISPAAYGYSPSTPSITAGGYFLFYATIGLSGSATTPNAGCSFTVTVTGTAT